MVVEVHRSRSLVFLSGYVGPTVSFLRSLHLPFTTPSRNLALVKFGLSLIKAFSVAQIAPPSGQFQMSYLVVWKFSTADVIKMISAKQWSNNGKLKNKVIKKFSDSMVLF